MTGATPRWSVMIPSHDDERFLPDALRSVLAQDPGAEEMQIEVVDDASALDPTPLVREVCGDRVGVHREPLNRGHVATFNTCIERARGQYVHLLHADDAVRPGFYERLGEALDANADVGAAFCRFIAMDERGNWTSIGRLEQPDAGVIEDWQEKLATGQRLQAPCIVVRKAVYDTLGGFDSRFRSYGEDWEMWTRIAADYPLWYEPEPLALYRLGSSSLSSGALRSGENVEQLLAVIDVNRERLPPSRRDALTAEARRVTASTAVRRGVRLARSRDVRGAAAQLRWAVRADRSPRTLALAALGAARAGAELALAHVRAGRGAGR